MAAAPRRRPDRERRAATIARKIAMRFGELVAVVASARGIDGNGVPASAVEALARLVAERIRS